MRLGDLDALKEHKFVGNKFVQIGGRTNGKTLKSINKAYQQGWNDCIDAIIDNAPTVEVPENEVNCVLTMFGKCSYNKTGCSDCEIKDKIRKALNERPTGKWIPIPLKTLNGDDIVAYKSSCCGAIADKKYQHCPKCNEKMEVKKNDD